MLEQENRKRIRERKNFESMKQILEYSEDIPTLTTKQGPTQGLSKRLVFDEQNDKWRLWKDISIQKLIEKRDFRGENLIIIKKSYYLDPCK